MGRRKNSSIAELVKQRGNQARRREFEYSQDVNKKVFSGFFPQQQDIGDVGFSNEKRSDKNKTNQCIRWHVQIASSRLPSM